MEYLAIGTTALAVLLATACFFLFSAREKASRRAAALELQLAASGTALEEAPRLREQLERLNKTSAIAETRATELEKQLQDAKAGQASLEAAKFQLISELNNMETQVKLANQRLQEEEIRRKDWEEQKKRVQEQHELVLAQAEKRLLELHRTETEASRKQTEEITKKTSEEVLGNLQKLIQSVNSTGEMNHRQEGRIDTLWRAMSAPSSMGALAEIGLENTLKNLGLESPRDYRVQYTIKSGEGGLRPDAVVFLPNDMVMVIDSKASKHVLEAAQAEGAEQEAEILAKLKKTMNDHLNALKSKDYSAAIQQEFRESGNRGTISMTLMVMYIPTEAALENLKKVDPEFLAKCEKADVIPATPASLLGLLSLASKSIGLMRQNENHEKIIHEVEQLIAYCVNALGYAESLGKSVESSMKHYNSFASSVNGRLLGKLKRVGQLGVPLPKNKSLPAKLRTFEVHESSQLIEGEVEQVEDSKVELLPRSRMADA